MARRSYRQHCALACALDVVGERWTLLLVRELLPGPRRYGELLANLPGMGTNLLAARLRDLQELGVIDHDGEGYALTERGAALEPTVVALAAWGAPLLADKLASEEHGHWSARWNALALKYAFRPERARGVRGVLEYRVDEEIVQARIAGGGIETAGSERWRPDVVVESDGGTLLGLAAGEFDPAEALADGSLVVTGDRKLFRASLRCFELPGS